MATVQTGIATEFINFTRASNATVTDSNGLIDWAAHNFTLYSEQFDNSYWTRVGLTSVTANSTAAPNGATTADLITPNTTATQHAIYMSGVSSATDLTHSVFVKSNGYTKVGLRESNISGAGAAFDLSGSGSVIGVYDSGGSTVSGAAISSLGNGWFLISCKITFAAVTAQALGVFVLSPSYVSGGNLYVSWTPNGTDGIYAWGAHLYRSDMGMQANTSAYPMYNPTTPKNLLGFTETFSDSYWGRAGTSVTANSINAPNGLATADMLTGDGASSVHTIAGSASAGFQKYVSVYAKAGTNSTFQIYFGGDAAPLANFNLASGTVGTVGSNQTASITDVGGGWYRCAIFTNSATATNPVIGLTLSSSAARGEVNTLSTSIYLWGAQLSDSASLDPYVANHFTAPSAAAYYGPRRDFDSAGVCRGLLVEEQRTNAVTYSNDFSNWSGSTATVNTNVVTAPDGTLTADEVVRATAASDHRFLAVTLTGDGSKAVSIFVKYNTAPTFSILLFDVTAVASRAEAVFTFTAGVPSATSTPAGSVEAIEPWGNGWYRIKMVATGVVAANTNRFYVYPAATGSSNGQKTTFWGAQAEVQTASFSTSLIPTIGATATRNADVAQVGTAAFPYSATEGTLVANGTAYNATSADSNFVTPAIVSLNGGTRDNYIGLDRTTGTNVARLIVRLGASPQATVTTSSWTNGATAKIGSAYAVNDFQLAFNGTLGTAATSGNVPAVDRLQIGSSIATAGFFNGHIRQITYIPRRLSNAELQTRTS